MKLRAVVFWILRHFGETVAIAQLAKDIKSELAARAEYALRYGVHPPAQWRVLIHRIAVKVCVIVSSIALMVALVFVATDAKAGMHNRQTSAEARRELIVNQTLDAVLEAGSDMAARHQRLTWQQIERDAAKKMNVPRNEWWNVRR